MAKETRAILSLVAMGRISAPEAERLLAAWRDGREWMWIAAICAAVCGLQAAPHIAEFGSLAHGLAAECGKVWHAVLSGMANGGRL